MNTTFNPVILIPCDYGMCVLRLEDVAVLAIKKAGAICDSRKKPGAYRPAVRVDRRLRDLHAALWGPAGPGLVWHHHDGDPYNNLRENVHPVSMSINSMASRPQRRRSGPRGIYPAPTMKNNEQYQVKIKIDGKSTSGLRPSLENAQTWRDTLVCEQYADLSWTNLSYVGWHWRLGGGHVYQKGPFPLEVLREDDPAAPAPFATSELRLSDFPRELEIQADGLTHTVSVEILPSETIGMADLHIKASNGIVRVEHVLLAPET